MEAYNKITKLPEFLVHENEIRVDGNDSCTEQA